MAENEEKIRRRAYELWEKAGRPEGRHHEHWEQARQEIEQYGAPEGADPGVGATSAGPAPEGARPGTGEPAKGPKAAKPRGAAKPRKKA